MRKYRISIDDSSNEKLEQGGFDQLFWDNLVKDSLGELKIKVRELKSDDLFEIDSLDELNQVEQLLQINKI